MPINVISALEGGQMVIPFKRDNLDGDGSNSSMSVVAIERKVRQFLCLDALVELQFIPAGGTVPLKTSASDDTTLQLILTQGREDFHERDVYYRLQQIEDKDCPPSVLTLKQHYSRIPDDTTPDGWKYIFH